MYILSGLYIAWWKEVIQWISPDWIPNIPIDKCQQKCPGRLRRESINWKRWISNLKIFWMCILMLKNWLGKEAVCIIRCGIWQHVINHPREPPVPYYRDIESTYNQLIDQWSKLLPDDFLEQLDSYVHNRVNESGWENGILFDCFVGKAFKDEHLLLVDPSPTFVRRCRKIDN